ncbi:MAG: exodeoxyribonuclease VII large subunit [Bacteroidota bacterium]
MVPPECIESVSELTRRVKTSVERAFPSVVVRGEISNAVRHSSGHTYFTLKDDEAQLAAVVWRSRIGLLGAVPRNGLSVVARGRLSVYEKRGVYQLDVTALREVGLGELQAAYEALKRKLAQEGLFADARKKPLPAYPERIGLVTSPAGAVLHDILRVLAGRVPVREAVLRPVRVQGEGAAGEIAQAVADFNSWGRVDVIVLARGGGSLEDLRAFNEEVVARAIAASRIPVVSAVGHETDYTIADFAADARAPTPSAAAEMVAPGRARVLETLGRIGYTMRSAVSVLLETHKSRVRYLLGSYAFNRPLDRFRQAGQRMDELDRSLRLAVSHRFSLSGQYLEALRGRVASLSPERTLRRGFAIVRKGGTAVSSAAVLDSGDKVEMEFQDGLKSSVID